MYERQHRSFPVNRNTEYSKRTHTTQPKEALQGGGCQRQTESTCLFLGLALPNCTATTITPPGKNSTATSFTNGRTTGRKPMSRNLHREGEEQGGGVEQTRADLCWKAWAQCADVRMQKKCMQAARCSTMRRMARQEAWLVVLERRCWESTHNSEV